MSLFSIIDISLQWQPAPHLFAFDYQHIHYLVYVKCMHFPGLFTDFIGKPSLFLYGSLRHCNIKPIINVLYKFCM